MPVFNNALAGAAGSGGAAADFKIERSLRFNTADTSFLEKTFSSAGNRKKWTWSGWVKKSQITDSQAVLFSAYGGSGNAYLSLDFRHDQPRFLNWNGSSIVDEVKASAKLRDPSAWYHIIWAVDTDQSTDADKVKLYINGVRQTQFETANYPSTGDSLYISNNIVHEIGRNVGTSSAGFNGYLAEVNFVDGQQLNPDGVFGEFDADTGVWNPIRYSGTYGTNGFHLDFAPTGGQIFSSGTLTGSIHSGNPLTRAFDGSTSTGTWAASSSGFELTFPSAINVASSITVVGGSSQSNYKVIVGGTEHTITFPNGSSSYTQEVTVNVSGSFTGIKATNNYGEIRGIRVDGGPLLIDHEAPGVDASGSRNHWTANNIELQAPTYAIAGTHSGKPGISFNGTNAEINLSSDADLNPGSGEFTLECYAYSNNNSSEFCIYDGSPGGVGSLVIRRVGAGTLMVERHNQAFDITGAQFSQNTWHHVAVTRDSSNNVRLFVDGTQSGSTSANNTHNYQGLFRLGRTNNGFTQGYISSLRLIKGSCLYTSNFTPPSGTLGDYLTTKLLMAQSTTSATAATVKPSGVTITGPGDNSVIDSLIDSPTNYEADSGNNGGNYCTWNPINKASSITTSDGNLKAQLGSTGHVMITGTMGMTSGKYYWEVVTNGWNTSNQGPMVGVVGDTHDISTQAGGSPSILFRAGGERMVDGTTTTGHSTFTAGDVIGVALDLDNNTITWYKNGTQLHQYTSVDASVTAWLPAWKDSDGGGNAVANWGQRPFSQTVPTGFKTLCTTNLDDPLIAKGSDYFQAKTYSGGNSSQSITTNFSPDLTWIKNRSTNHTDHILGNSLVPGAHLYSNGTWTEGSGRITSLNSNGFTVGTHDTVNQSGDEYISWNWNGGDLVTNSDYDQSEVWSSFWSATGNGIEAANPATNSFDGVLTGLGMRLNGSSSCTWAPTGGYSYSGDFLIYACKDNDYTNVSWTVVHAGGTTDITTSVAAGTTMTELNLTNLGVQSPITSISFTSNNNSNPRIAGMKANGKILVDAGVVPIGSLNDTIYNTTSNWSTAGSNMQNNWSASFDGDTDPHFALPNTGYSASMTFPSAISYQTLELVVARDIYAPDLLMNGNALNVPATDTNTTGGRYKIERLYFTNGTLTSIGHETRNTAGRGGSGFWQIIVDGKILVDTNQASSAPNVPSIATTCTSNPTAGFAISTYKGNSTDGASIAHNLGSTPEMVIVKGRDKSDDWRVYHVGAGNPYYLRLQLTNERTGTNNWREMSPNYFAIDADSAVNSSSHNYVAYSFSSVEGYSLVSSYQGQNRFVYCGFRPRFC